MKHILLLIIISTLFGNAYAEKEKQDSSTFNPENFINLNIHDKYQHGNPATIDDVNDNENVRNGNEEPEGYYEMQIIKYSAGSKFVCGPRIYCVPVYCDGKKANIPDSDMSYSAYGSGVRESTYNSKYRGRQCGAKQVWVEG